MVSTKRQPAARLLALTALLAGAATRAEVEVVTLSEQRWYEAEDRALARELVSPRNSSVENLSIAEIVVPAGVSVRPHHHVMEEIYHIVTGEGVVMVEDERRVVGPGDSVVIAPHEWHNVRNEGDEELRMLVTCAPAWAPEHLIFERDRMPGDGGGGPARRAAGQSEE